MLLRLDLYAADAETGPRRLEGGRLVARELSGRFVVVVVVVARELSGREGVAARRC